MAVDVTNFVTASDASNQAFKTATLLKTLNVNALITGEIGVGKSSLAEYILPDAPTLDASFHDEIITVLGNTDKIVIYNLEHSPNLLKVLESVSANSVRLIATAKTSFVHERLDEIFSIKFDIPSLAQRPEDVKALIQKFAQEASELFACKKEFNFEGFTPDITLNAKSLKRQVMMNYLLDDITDKELMHIMENYLLAKLGSNSDYRNFLYLYEAPLINAGLQKYKSQLQLADRLGLNRNTLRKKIAENDKYLYKD